MASGGRDAARFIRVVSGNSLPDGRMVFAGLATMDHDTARYRSIVQYQ